MRGVRTVTNYLIIQNVLKDAQSALSSTQIHIRAKRENPDISQEAVSAILSRMRRKGKVTREKDRAGSSTLHFYRWDDA